MIIDDFDIQKFTVFKTKYNSPTTHFMNGHAPFGYDPHAAADIPRLVDQLLAGTPGWQQGKINFPLDSADERGYRIQFELKHNKLQQTPQTIGQMPAVKDELGARP